MKSWIYQLSKQEAIDAAEKRGLDSSGNLDTIRSRLSKYMDEMSVGGDPPKSPGAGDFKDAETGPPRLNSLHIPPPLYVTPPTDEHGIAKTMNQIRKWGCHYNGKDPLAFLERITELQGQYRYSSEIMLQGVPEFLRGDALAWYRNRGGDWRTWEEFIQAFTKHFVPRQYRARLAREVQDRRQKPGETFEKYSTHIMTLMRRAGTFSREEMVDRVYENLRADYKMFIRYEHATSIDAIEERAYEFEELMKDKEQENREAKRAITATAAAVPYDKQSTCWRCKQRGHTRFDCRNVPKKFCSQCGRDNVFTRDCHPRPGNAVRAGDNEKGPRPENGK